LQDLGLKALQHILTYHIRFYIPTWLRPRHSRGRDRQASDHGKSCLILQLGARAVVFFHCSLSHHIHGSNQEGNQSLSIHPSPSADEEQGRVPCSASSLQACYQVPKLVGQTSMHEKQPEIKKEKRKEEIRISHPYNFG
jgi:hypothetical protein